MLVRVLMSVPCLFRVDKPLTTSFNYDLFSRQLMLQWAGSVGACRV